MLNVGVFGNSGDRVRHCGDGVVVVTSTWSARGRRLLVVDLVDLMLGVGSASSLVLTRCIRLALVGVVGVLVALASQVANVTW